MSNEAVYRTAPATQGLLKTHHFNLYVTRWSASPHRMDTGILEDSRGAGKRLSKSGGTRERHFKGELILRG